MDTSDSALHSKADVHSNSSSSASSLARANSLSRGISIKTVSPSYHVRHVSESVSSLANGRARKDSVNTLSNASSDSQSPVASPGAFSASQAPCGTELKTFHSRRSSTTSRRDSVSLSSDTTSMHSRHGSRVEFRPLSSFGTSGNHDFSLPPAAELSKLDINEQLRLLALKEMSVVEMRDSIASMKSKLHDSECDLANLRHLIQKSLYRELNLQHQATQKSTHNPAHHAQENTRSRHPSSGNGSIPLKPSNKTNESRGVKLPEENSYSNKAGDRSSKIWANLSKPINFIQSLDSMLSSEFEKSLVGDLKREYTGYHASQKNLHSRRISRDNQDEEEIHHKYRTQNQNQNQNQNQTHTSDTSAHHSRRDQNLSSREHYNNQNHQNQVARNRHLDHQADTRTNQTRDGVKRDQEDMFYTVSNSLWTFVNEVKTNVISTINDSAEHLVSPPKSPPPHEPSDEIPVSPLNSELEDPQDFEKSGDDEESIDLSMYASMRRTK